VLAVTSASAFGGSGVWKIKTIAGNGHGENTGDGGPAIKAGLSPGAIALDARGNIYVVSFDRVRKISPGGTITRFAGGGAVGYKDGIQATSAGLLGPSALAVDAGGNLYIAEQHDVRKVGRDGMITTVAGGYNNQVPTKDPEPATNALLDLPRALAFDKQGNLYIADFNHVVKVTPGGTATTFAGSWEEKRTGLSGDGGPAAKALLSDPSALGVDAKGNVYIADGGDVSHFRVRKVSLDGTIRTVARGAGRLVVDKNGNFYADVGRVLRRFSPDGKTATTIAGGGTQVKDGPARANVFGASGMSLSAQGKIYFSGGSWVRVLYLAPS
jgi:hypothetical protein